MSKLRQATEQLPGAARLLTQFAVDNPAAVLTGLSGLIVLEKAAYNLVRPRTAVEAAALCVVLSIAAPWLAAELVRRGVLEVKIRDHHGCLHSARDILAGDENHADQPG